MKEKEPIMIVLAVIPREASTIEDTQIHTKRSLMEVERFLFLLMATMTILLRLIPKHPNNNSSNIHT